MGETARRVALRRMTPSERFDAGLLLSERMMEAVIRRAGIPDGLSREEHARRAFAVLRRASE